MAATLRMRVLACPNCGAKLRYEQGAPVIECCYCQTHVVVSTRERTTLPTSTIAIPAPRLPRVLIALPIAVIAVSVIATVAVRNHGPRSTKSSAAAARTSTTADLLATPLASTAADVAARHGVSVLGDSVTIALSDGAFREARWSWEPAHRDHVSSIMLRPRDAAADLGAIAERANRQLAGRLRPAATGGFQFSAKSVSLQVSSYVQFFARPDTDPAWKQHVVALWTVVKGAAFQTSDTIDEATRRDVLNLAYPVTVINEIAFDTIVDDAAAEVKRIAPAADADRERFTIGVAHPWFDSAMVRWDNAPGGRWTQAHLWFREPHTMARLEELAACLEPLLGTPTRNVADHLAGTFTLQYRARGGRPWMDVSAQLVQMYPHYGFGEPATAEGLHAVVTKLAACGS